MSRDTRSFVFDNKGEALAFVQGINFANDSRWSVLTMHELRPPAGEGKWEVVVGEFAPRFTGEQVAEARAVVLRARKALGDDLGGFSGTDLLLDNLSWLKGSDEARDLYDLTRY